MKGDVQIIKKYKINMDIGKNKNDLSASVNEKRKGESLNPWMLYPIYTIFMAKNS